MSLQEMLKPGGKGVLSTASKEGVVNTAVYAVPHFADADTLAWGMTDGRTWENIRANPNAAYTYFRPGEGYEGMRLTLVLLRTEDSGEMLARIRERARGVTSGAPDAVKHVAFFRVTERRPLV